MQQDDLQIVLDLLDPETAYTIRCQLDGVIDDALKEPLGVLPLQRYVDLLRVYKRVSACCTPPMD